MGDWFPHVVFAAAILAFIAPGADAACSLTPDRGTVLSIHVIDIIIYIFPYLSFFQRLLTVLNVYALPTISLAQRWPRQDPKEMEGNTGRCIFWYFYTPPNLLNDKKTFFNSRRIYTIPRTLLECSTLVQYICIAGPLETVAMPILGVVFHCCFLQKNVLDCIFRRIFIVSEISKLLALSLVITHNTLPPCFVC